MRLRRTLARGVVVMSVFVFAASSSFGRTHRGSGGPSRPSRSGGPTFHAPAPPRFQGRVFVAPGRAGGGYSPRVMAGAPAAPQRSSWWHFGGGAKVPPPGGAGRAPSFASGAHTGPAGFHPPARDQRGGKISARPMFDTSKNAALIHQTVANGDFSRSVLSLTGAESDRDGQYHWYNRGGVQFAHWYDSAHGRDWFGFYRGGVYFWTVSWHDHFWWQEPRSGRWLVFWRDQWWWHGPDGQIYVYSGDDFYLWQPTATGATLVLAPAPAAGDAHPPAVSAPGEGLVISSRPEFNYSADGTRMVQVEGEKLSAYLYDMTKLEAGGGSHFMKELGDGVTAVAFSDTSGGEPLRITLSVQDATGAIHPIVLDAEGNRVSGNPAPATSPPVVYGAHGQPGFDAPATDMPPTDSPYSDGN